MPAAAESSCSAACCLSVSNFLSQPPGYSIQLVAGLSFVLAGLFGLYVTLGDKGAGGIRWGELLESLLFIIVGAVFIYAVFTQNYLLDVIGAILLLLGRDPDRLRYPREPDRRSIQSPREGMMARVYVGTCNWADHTDFYPAGLPSNQQLAYYAEHFPVVEINSTFYHMMPERNFRLWAERTPPGFVFDVKPYRQLTWHDRKKPPDDDITAAFRQVLQPLRDADKLGAINFQFPPWFVYRAENLEYIRHCRDAFPEDRLSVEFRHRSWLESEHVSTVVDTLRKARIGLTVGRRAPDRQWKACRSCSKSPRPSWYWSGFTGATTRCGMQSTADRRSFRLPLFGERAARLDPKHRRAGREHGGPAPAVQQ